MDLSTIDPYVDCGLKSFSLLSINAPKITEVPISQSSIVTKKSKDQKCMDLSTIDPYVDCGLKSFSLLSINAPKEAACRKAFQRQVP